MLRQLHSILAPVRWRLRLDRALRWCATGLLLGAVLGSLLLVAQWGGLPITPAHAFLTLVASGLTGALAGLLWRTSWKSSATVVDGAFGLKDRTLTALDFAARGDDEPIRTLQIRDAIERLTAIDVSKAAPWRRPRLAPAAAGAVSVMLALFFVSYPPGVSQASLAPEPLEVVLDQADLLEETLLEELQELSEETEEPEVEQLVEEMKEAIKELREPEVDQREALAQLSEMQAALAAAMRELDTQQVDAQLQQLAEALQDADASQSASQSLKESDYENAAKELEKIDASSMSRKERKALSENLAKLSSNLGEGRKGQLGESVQEMLEGLEKESFSQCKSGMCKAAGVCRKQGVRKKISECLGCQLNRLAECKGACQGQCDNPNAAAKKSNTPSTKAGKAASNSPTGEDKTRLDSRRRDENLTGAQGDGPSERETIASNDARQDAARSYRERYAEYRKQMEEVLDSEPLPLGHRETVRQYFESIRPSGSDELE